MFIKVIPLADQHGQKVTRDWTFECDVYERAVVILSPFLAAGDFDFNIWDVDADDESENAEYTCVTLRFWAFGDENNYFNVLLRNAAVYVMNNDGNTIDRFSA